jgi:VWFA-related protein
VKARWLILIPLAAAVWAQPPAPQPEVVSHEAPATFSTRVNLVSVPVVVRDRNGHAVGGLRKEDFQLFDKGKLQEITKFTIESAEAAVIEAPAAVPAPESLTLPAASPPVVPSRFVAYVFDDVHMKPADLLNARQAANKHLDQSLDASMRAAVFTTSGQGGQDFTDDREKLHAAVNRIQPASHGTDRNQDCPYLSYYLADWLVNKTGSLNPVAKDPSAATTDDAMRAVIDETKICLHTTDMTQILAAARASASRAMNFGRMETETALGSLREIVRRVSIMPGARSLVLVSPGFLLLDDHRFDEYELLDRAIKASVTVNTLDIRGLYTPPGSDASEHGYNSPSAGILMRYDITAASAQADTLAEVADGTGGTFFHNDNGLQQGLDQLAARPEFVYVLGFSPQNLKLDGSYHGLKVSLKNPAALTTRARRGYWAPNHKIDPAEQSREEIREAVFSLEETQEIPIELTTEFFKSSEAKAELTVSARLGLSSLKFRKAEERNRDTLTVVTGLFDQNGRYLKGIERVIEMRLRDQTLEKAVSAGMSVKESFDVPPGRYVVRVVVRDSEGQSMASRNGTVEIQ